MYTVENDVDANGEITRLITDWQNGEPAAESALFEAIYARLHQIAKQHVRGERPSATLSATALVHDAYLRLSRSVPVDIAGSAHLMRLMSRVMRQLLVDRARAHRATKRDGGEAIPDGAERVAATERDADEILAVHRALDKLERNGSKLRKELVELRFFGGYSMEECSAILGVPLRTLHNHWKAAKLAMREEMDDNERRTD